MPCNELIDKGVSECELRLAEKRIRNSNPFGHETSGFPPTRDLNLPRHTTAGRRLLPAKGGLVRCTVTTAS